MRQFLAVFLGSPTTGKFKAWTAMDANEREERERRGIEAWQGWIKKHSAAIVDVGTPLGQTKKVDERGVADTKNLLAAYAIVRAKTHAQAAKLFLGHPHFKIFPGDSIEIMECLPLPSERLKAKKAAKNDAKKHMTSEADEAIATYINTQKPEQAKVCRLLQKEISANLPKAVPRLYHSIPVWFIGENAVVGFSVNAKGEVNLLFWNGQALGEPGLRPTGKFKAAQIQFREVSEVDMNSLKRWLKKAGKDIWDFASLRKQR